MEDEKKETSKWMPLKLTSSAEMRLEVTLNCGQCFRWKRRPDDSWSGVIGGNVFLLKETPEDIMYYHVNSNKNDSEEKIKSIISDYFLLSKYSLVKLFEHWSDQDSEFKNCAVRFRGLRLIRQDPLECIFSFICSQNNNISRITKMIDSLCSSHGNYLCEHEGSKYYQFPSLEQLLKIEEQELRDLGFGYRAKYIVKAAQQVKEKGPEWLKSLRTSTKKESHKELLELMGIGRKVADCICLFSLDKVECIPVDTHVWKIAQRYLPKLKAKKLNDQIYEEIGEFFKTRFGNECGWAHTILFANELSIYKNTKVGNEQNDNGSKEEVNPEIEEGDLVNQKVEVKMEVDLQPKSSTSVKRGRTTKTSTAAKVVKEELNDVSTKKKRKSV